MSFASRQDAFSIPNSIIDLAGITFAGISYVSMATTNRQASEENVEFSFIDLAAYVSIYVLSYALVTLRCGNGSKFGLTFLLLVSTVGSFIFVCGTLLLLALYRGVDSFEYMGLGISLFLFCTSFVTTFVISFVFRMIAVGIGTLVVSPRD